MISSPDNEGVIMIGGETADHNGKKRLDTVLELRVGTTSWNVIQNLKEPRNGHIVIPIPKWP